MVVFDSTEAKATGEAAVPDVPSTPSVLTRRGRGRPALMDAAAVLERIRLLARAGEGLYRVHRTHSSLYARARRQFGSWADAVRAAGVNYVEAIAVARMRSIETRRKQRRRRPQLG